ncbi:MAG: TrbI/VirB10 family protein [Bdellovibrionales bacterium]|nr:TrbI/VirB10 family protein [Bdellovibrionales bacterium]
MKRLSQLQQTIKSFFMTKNGGKEVLHLSRVAWFCLVILISGMLFTLTRPKKDHRSVRISSTPIIEEKGDSALDHKKAGSSKPRGVASAPVPRGSSTKRNGRRKSKAKLLQFSGPQLIERKKESNFMAQGIRTKGTLLTGIDTRTPTQVQVLLSSGILHHEREILPPGTTLLGAYSYPGTGKEIHLNLSQALLPSGHIQDISAQALDAKRLTLGIRARRHRNTSGKLAAAMGSTMIQAAGDVLTEKEALSQFGEPTAKSTLKNAFTQGVSNIGEMETQRHLNELGHSQEYATLHAGTPIVIELLSIQPRKK